MAPLTVHALSHSGLFVSAVVALELATSLVVLASWHTRTERHRGCEGAPGAGSTPAFA